MNNYSSKNSKLILYFNNILFLIYIIPFTLFSYTLQIDSGSILHANYPLYQWRTVSGGTILLNSGDSIAHVDPTVTVVSLEQGRQLQLRDSCILSFLPHNSEADFFINRGHIFLNRKDTATSLFSLQTTHCLFDSIDAASFEVDRLGNLAIAVLRGNVRAIKLSDKKGVAINAGYYGYYRVDIDGFTIEKLPPEVIEEWLTDTKTVVSKEVIKEIVKVKDTVAVKKTVVIIPSGFFIHTVNEGESVSLVCILYYGYYTRKLARIILTLNPSIEDVNVIHTGSQIKLPAFDKKITSAKKVRPRRIRTQVATSKPEKAGEAPFIVPFTSEIIATQGIVTLVKGKAYLKRKGWESKNKLTQNVEVFPGDTITTGQKAYVEMIINREEVVRIDGNSTIIIESLGDITGDTRKTKVKILNGSLWTKIKRSVGKVLRFDISLPTVIAGVYGTTFRSTVRENGACDIKVFDGKVAVKGKDKGWSQKIESSHKMEIHADGTPSEVHSFSGKPSDAFEKWNTRRDVQAEKLFNTPPGSFPQGPAYAQSGECPPCPECPSQTEETGIPSEVQEGPENKFVEFFKNVPKGFDIHNIWERDNRCTRVAFNIEVPVWRFGICFDIELFFNEEGHLSKKGWEFTRDLWFENLTRKFKYIRLNKEEDIFFMKIGALDDVTIGYGLIVNRFANTLDYPGIKLFGGRMHLLDAGKIGFTMQTMIADFLDFQYAGGIMAGRMAFIPLKATEKPVISGLEFGATYAIDYNQYAPARKKDPAIDPKDKNNNGIIDLDYWVNKGYTQEQIDSLIAKGDADTSATAVDMHYDDSLNAFSILGFDLSFPIIKKKALSLILYNQIGFSLDDRDGDRAHGWGLGAPGLLFTTKPFSARLEYRHISDQFIYSFFDRYYLKERFMRYAYTVIKEDNVYGLKNISANGVYGSADINIADIFLIHAGYLRMVGKKGVVDQTLDASFGLGSKLLDVLPLLTLADVSYFKSHIEDNTFFERSPTRFITYRFGAQFIPGTQMILEVRQGWKYVYQELVKNNSVKISAGIMF